MTPKEARQVLDSLLSALKRQIVPKITLAAIEIMKREIAQATNAHHD